MTKRRFRFGSSTLKSRAKKGKPVWLWKWTKDAYHDYKQRKKKGRTGDY